MLRKTLVYVAALLPNLMLILGFCVIYDWLEINFKLWLTLSCAAMVGYVFLAFDVWSNDNLTRNSKSLLTAVVLLTAIPVLLIYFRMVALRTTS